MKKPARESYLTDKGIMHFIKKLKELQLDARKKREIFFAMNLKGFKKLKIRGGK